MKKHGENQDKRELELEICIANILAARGVSDFIRTSLGPKGMDKMITRESDDVLVSNDGATILENLDVIHPAARMLVELSKSQDIEAGDGTTSVVIIAGALLEQSKILIEKGIHPNVISENIMKCLEKVPQIIDAMAKTISAENDEVLTDIAVTSLNSKIVSPESPLLAPIAVKAVKMVMESIKNKNHVNLKSIRIVTKLGGTIEDSTLINGLVFDRKASHKAGGPTLIKNAKIGLIQFQLSPPKTNMDFDVTIGKKDEMDQIHIDQKKYMAKIVSKIAKSGCNVLLIQKSMIRDAVCNLSLHFLAKKGIMVVTDIERDDVPFITKSLGCRPIAFIDDFTSDKLGSADLAKEIKTFQGSLISITGVRHPGLTASVLLRGASKIVLDEAERSFHDALCVVRCLVEYPRLIPGGAAAEMELSVKLRQSESENGVEELCKEALAEALESIPFTLAENCGMNPLKIVTELRDAHLRGEKGVGIDVRRGRVSELEKERVVQPALVTLRAVSLAAECVRMILKIDGLIMTSKQ